MRSTADLVIICALASELRKVMDIGDWRELPKDGDVELTTYWSTTWESSGGEPLRVIAAQSPQMGMPAAAVLTAKMISQFEPMLVAIVGIAAGVRDEGRGFGDILVPSRTLDYGAGKVREDSDNKLVFLPEPEPIDIDPLLDSRLRFWAEHRRSELDEIRRGWVARAPGTVLKMHLGTLGSGAQVIASEQPVNEVRSHWRKLIGIEMEAHGVNVACRGVVHPPPLFLCMKSVCDFADKLKSDDWQDYAAYTSARLFHRFVIAEWANLNIGAIRRGRAPRAVGVAEGPSNVERAALPEAPLRVERLPLRATTNPWSAAAVGSVLWRVGASVEVWRAAVEAVVDACYAAASSSGEDVWRDDELPVRVLGVMESLVRVSSPSVELELPEVALMIVAPFLREAAVAGGVTWMSEARPLELTIEGAATGPRISLEREHQARAPFVRKATRLREQHREPEYRAVLTWLMHGCLGREPALWELPPLGQFPRAVHDAIEAVRRRGGATREAFLWSRARELARCTFADPERIDRDDRPDSLRDEERIDGAAVRPKLLGYLICLASWMAMDVRRLPELLIEHIGLSDTIAPRDVIETLRQAHWAPSPVGLSLQVTCEHPAIDHALRVGVERAGVVLDRIHARSAANYARLERLVGLPKRLTPDDIRPASTADGRPAYSMPHLRFELAHEEVKELLMGEQLYGDPRLAIRELYQNALDACRYREARETFIRQTKRGIPSRGWAGEIRFRQDIEDGRPFIECEDNGVGMGLAELEGCFARAGKRFHDMPEFLEEQTEWLSVEPPIQLYPNGQFGIGVFSYFMLADEIEVETCRFHRDGTLGSHLRVRIAGSGSLFRVQQLGEGHKAGSRIRLYLNKTETITDFGRVIPISCTEILKEVLWISEYITSCVESGTSKLSWQPHELAAHLTNGIDDACRIHEDVWCVPPKLAAVLADGIKTETSTSDHLIVNLRRSQRPVLTVDRKSVRDFDISWVVHQIFSNLSQIAAWAGLTLDFLWWLDDGYPWIAEKLVAHLLQQGVRVRSYQWSGTVDMSNVGCLWTDSKILDYCRRFDWSTELYDSGKMPSLPEEFLRQRLKMFGQLGVRVPQEFHDALSDADPEITIVVPQAGDAALLEEFDQGGSLIPLVFMARNAKCTICEVYHRLQPYVPVGLHLPELTSTELSSLEFVPTTQDVALLSRQGDGRYPRISSSVSAVVVCCIAINSGHSVEQILNDLSRFSTLGVRPPELSIEELKTLEQIAREYLPIFSRNLDGRSPFLFDVSAFHLFAAAATVGQTIPHVYDVMKRFEGHGIALPKNTREKMIDYRPSKVEAEQISNVFPKGALLSASAAILASGGDMKVLKLVHLVRRVTGTWTFPGDAGDLDAISIDFVDRRLLTRDLDGDHPPITDTVPMEHVRRASEALRIDVEEVLQRLRKFERLGIRVAADEDARGM